MSKRFWVGLVTLIFLVTTPVLFAYNNTWDDAFENLPPDSELASLGAGRIRDLKEATRERLDDEHAFSTAAAGTDTGVHLEGSARIWVQDDEPSLTTGGLTLDDGNIWFETDTEKLWVYDLDDEVDWIEVVDSDDRMTLSTDQTATGTKTFDLAAFKRLMLKQLTVTAETYTAGADYNFYLCDTSANDITLTLADGTSSVGSEIQVFKLIEATNALYITAGAGETIEGAADFEINVLNDYIIIASDGASAADWRIISAGSPSSNTVGDDELDQTVEDRLYHWTVFDEFGGDGSDEDQTYSSGTEFADDGTGFDDVASDNIIVCEFNNLTIDSGAELSFAGKIFIIGVKGTLSISDNTSAIVMDGKGGIAGSIASNAAGGDGADGGAFWNTPIGNLPPFSNLAGAGGGAGGSFTQEGGAGGTAGTVGGTGTGTGEPAGAGGTGGSIAASRKAIGVIPANMDRYEWIHRMLYSFGGGGGSSGGHSSGPVAGEPGGNGGGFIYIEASDVVFANTVGITSIGLDGDDSALENVGGGGGGGGGCVILLYKTVSGSVVTSADGGSGGAKASGTRSGAGGDGADGSVIILDVDG